MSSKKTYKNIQFHVDDKNIARIFLNRPDNRNAFNSEMISELTDVFNKINNHNPRFCVIQGNGKAFCAGADLNMMQQTAQLSQQENEDEALKLEQMFFHLNKINCPVISVVHSSAFGGALGLIACSDIVIAEEKTQFGFSEVKLGLVPAVISSYILRKTSQAKLAPWMISGRVFDASTALQVGLIHEICPLDQKDFFLSQWEQSLLQAAPKATSITKNLINKICTTSIDQHQKLTTQLIASVRVSTEGQEGLKSFLEKRKPNWNVN